MDFLLVFLGATSEYRFKVGILVKRCQFGSKFPVEGVVFNNHSSCRKTRINVLPYGIIMWAQVSFVLSQCTRLTDGQKGFRHTVSCITCSRTEKNAQPLFACKRCKITPFNLIFMRWRIFLRPSVSYNIILFNRSSTTQSPSRTGQTSTVRCGSGAAKKHFRLLFSRPFSQHAGRCQFSLLLV